MRPDDFFAAIETRQGLAIPALRNAYTPPTMTQEQAEACATTPRPTYTLYRGQPKCACGEPKPLNANYCEACKKRKRAETLRRSAQRRPKGTCPDCGAEIANGSKRCRICASRHANNLRRVDEATERLDRRR